MMHPTRSLVLVFTYLLSGCAGTAPTASPSTPAAKTSEHLPPPFSAAELRKGISAGTQMRFQVESAGSPTVIQEWLFRNVDDQGCTIAARILATDGSLISDNGTGTSTWAELESHAHFPAAHSTRRESTVVVPAGEFATWYFEVKSKGPGSPVSRFHFAKELPGPPVWMEVTKNGVVTTKMILLSRT